jgi:type II secretion system protein L
MREELYIRFLNDEQGAVEWLVRSGSEVANSGFLDESNRIEELSETARGKSIKIMLPGSESLTQWLTIPKRQARQLIKAIPFMMEDKLATDIDGMHFATGRRQGDLLEVIAISHARLKKYLAVLTQFKLRVDAAFIDTQALNVDAPNFYVDAYSFLGLVNQQSYRLEQNEWQSILPIISQSVTDEAEIKVVLAESDFAHHFNATIDTVSEAGLEGGDKEEDADQEGLAQEGDDQEGLGDSHEISEHDEIDDQETSDAEDSVLEEVASEESVSEENVLDASALDESAAEENDSHDEESGPKYQVELVRQGLAHLVAHLPSNNILQGAYDNKESVLAKVGHWKVPFALAATWFIVSLVTKSVVIWDLNQQTERVSQKIETTYKQAFPNQKINKGINLTGIMRQKLKGIGDVSSIDSGYLPLLEQLSKGFASPLDVKPTYMTYTKRTNELRVDLDGKDVESLTKFEAMIKTSEITATLSSMNSNEERFTARLVLRAES